MTDREVYPNASVVLVALEVRHPAAARLSGATKTKIKNLLRARLPLSKPGEITHVTQIPGSEPEIRTQRFDKYLSRNLTTSASFKEQSIVVETTAYRYWEDFLELVELVLQVRANIGDIDGVERIGLRYIDEIRVPETTVDWSNWVSRSLLVPEEMQADEDLVPTSWQSVSAYRRRNRSAVTLRYGPREGYAVDPKGDLRRPVPPPGEFFLIDIDSYWTRTDTVPEFDLQDVISTCHDLHTPVRRIFEGLITERLRNEVLRRD